MDLEKFEDLTFYEWMLYVERHRVKMDRQKFEWETGWDHTRNIMAMVANAGGGKKGGGSFSPSDFIKLSYDTSTGNEPLTEEKAREIFEHAKKRFGSKINKDGK